MWQLGNWYHLVKSIVNKCIYCNIAYWRMTYYFCHWWRHLFINEIVNYFQAESLVHCSASFCSFLDPHPWPEIHPSVTFLGIDIFFSETCYGIRDLIRFCVTKPKFLGKISFGKKRPAIVKMAPKQGFLDEN